MRHALRDTVLLLGIGTTVAIGWPVGAQGLKQQAIGFYLTVIGKSTVVHVGQPAAMPVKLRERVYFKDVIETQADSRAKALFDDDSILTVGENSRVEVSEYIYDPANNQRSSVLRMIQGKARALVGKLFAGLGSKFEVHTPTAVAAARGTYFVVWIEEKASQKMGLNEIGTVRPVSDQGLEVAELQAGGTGVANIGSSGNVALTSGGKTVEVPPGSYAFAPPGMPPFAPVIITPTAPPGVTGAITSTEVPDVPQPESPGQVVTALGQGVVPLVGAGGPIIAPPSPVLPGLTPPSPISGAGISAIINTPGGNLLCGVVRACQAECPSCAQ
jgi:hypothetical protein